MTQPQFLIDDFSARAESTQCGVRALHDALCDAIDNIGSGDAGKSLVQWRDFFRKTCGQDWPRPKARLDRLASLYGVAHDPARPEIVLFVLQSWYVVLLKLLAGHVLAFVRGKRSPAEEAAGGDARAAIAALEHGQVFSDLAATDPCCGEPFGWLAGAWSPALERAVVAAASRIAAYDPAALMAYAAAGGDLLKPLYESLFPRSVRHALGEYYTPDWLAEHVLDQVGYSGQPDLRLLDPTCGSGTFLLAAIRRWRANVGWDERARERRSTIVTCNFPAFSPDACVGRVDADASVRAKHRYPVHRCDGGPALASSLVPPYAIAGFDVHPLAVASARANYLLAIADLIDADSFIDIPVFARDAILDVCPDPPAFDFVVGNPPWIAWDNLPADYREATKPHWQRYGLFSLSGNDARHGGGKKDLSMLVLYSAADRWLRAGGWLGMVITQTLFQSKGAGDGFRRFRIGSDGALLKVLRVDDLVDVRPFGDAANWTSVVTLQKGEATVYPVPYVKWSAGAGGERLPAAVKTDLLARPMDPACPTAPWTVYSTASLADRDCAVGRADYTAHLGANSGGANAVYWLEVLDSDEQGVRVRNLAAKAKRAVELVEAVIEPDLLYPLLRWGDVARWSARPSAYLLLAQDTQTRTGIDEDRIRRDCPRTFAYLKQFEPLLTARAAYRRYQDRQPFYSMYNVGPYTVAAAKVIWRRMDRRIRAAVVETIDDPHLGRRPIIPQETCVLIACESGDEAHYLCALMNSSIVHELVASHSVAGGKGFGTPSILDYLPLRKFNSADARHMELVALSRKLHAALPRDGACGDSPDEQRLDEIAAKSLARQSSVAR